MTDRVTWVAVPGRDYPAFPEIEAEIGENPARFLEGANPALLKARRRGIDRVDVARRWIEVEIELADIYDRAPRSDLISYLNKRTKYLKEHGEREDHLQEQREIRVDDVDVDEDQDEPREHRHVKCGSTDVYEEKSGMAWYCNECEMRCPDSRIEVVDGD